MRCCLLGLVVLFVGCSKAVPEPLSAVDVDAPTPFARPGLADPGVVAAPVPAALRRAEYDGSDLDSTYRWVRDMVGLQVIDFAVEKSSVQTQEAKDAAWTERRELLDDLHAEFKATHGNVVHWKGVVSEVGPAGLVFSCRRDGEIEMGGKSSWPFALTVALIAPPAPGKDWDWVSPPQSAFTLRVGEQIAADRLARTKVGDPITIVGRINDWFRDDPTDSRPPHQVTVFLEKSHVLGFVPPIVPVVTAADRLLSGAIALASADAGFPVSRSDSHLELVSEFLAACMSAYSVDADRVVQNVLFTRKKLVESASRASCRDLLSGLTEFRLASSRRVDLGEACAMYLVQRIDRGKSHGDVVASMVAAAHALDQGGSQVPPVLESEKPAPIVESTIELEKAADAKLASAKALIKSGKRSLAVAKLRDLVAKYPKTDAATQARVLLGLRRP